MQPSSKAHQLTVDDATHRVRDLIARVSRTRNEWDAERMRPITDFRDLMQLLVREIDETVLPRRLALVSKDEVAAILVVSNRRLIGLEIENRSLKFGDDDLSDANIMARAYARALKKVVVQSGPLTLRPMGRAALTSTTNTACSAEHLAPYCDTQSFENRLKKFLKAFHKQSFGWIFHSASSETVAHSPDESVFALLKTLDETSRSQKGGGKNRPKVSRSGPVCAAFAISPEIQVLIASDSKEHLVLAIPQSDATAALTHWKSVFER